MSESQKDAPDRRSLAKSIEAALDSLSSAFFDARSDFTMEQLQRMAPLVEFITQACEDPQILMSERGARALGGTEQAAGMSRAKLADQQAQIGKLRSDLAAARAEIDKLKASRKKAAVPSAKVQELQTENSDLRFRLVERAKAATVAATEHTRLMNRVKELESSLEQQERAATEAHSLVRSAIADLSDAAQRLGVDAADSASSADVSASKRKAASAIENPTAKRPRGDADPSAARVTKGQTTSAENPSSRMGHPRTDTKNPAAGVSVSPRVVKNQRSGNAKSRDSSTQSPNPSEKSVDSSARSRDLRAKTIDSSKPPRNPRSKPVDSARRSASLTVKTSSKTKNPKKPMLITPENKSSVKSLRDTWIPNDWPEGWPEEHRVSIPHNMDSYMLTPLSSHIGYFGSLAPVILKAGVDRAAASQSLREEAGGRQVSLTEIELVYLKEPWKELTALAPLSFDPDDERLSPFWAAYLALFAESNAQALWETTHQFLVENTSDRATKYARDRTVRIANMRRKWRQVMAILIAAVIEHESLDADIFLDPAIVYPPEGRYLPLIPGPDDTDILAFVRATDREEPCRLFYSKNVYAHPSCRVASVKDRLVDKFVLADAGSGVEESHSENEESGRGGAESASSRQISRAADAESDPDDEASDIDGAESQVRGVVANEESEIDDDESGADNAKLSPRKSDSDDEGSDSASGGPRLDPKRKESVPPAAESAPDEESDAAPSAAPSKSTPSVEASEPASILAPASAPGEQSEGIDAPSAAKSPSSAQVADSSSSAENSTSQPRTTTDSP